MLLSSSTLTWAILTNGPHFSVSEATLDTIWHGMKYRGLPTWRHYLDENVQDLAKAAIDVFTTVINEQFRATSNLTFRTFSLQHYRHDTTHIAQLLFNQMVMGSILGPSLSLSLWQRSVPLHQVEKSSVTYCRNWLVLLLYSGILYRYVTAIFHGNNMKAQWKQHKQITQAVLLHSPFSVFFF